MAEKSTIMILIDNDGEELETNVTVNDILYRIMANNYELVKKTDEYDKECVINRKHYYIKYKSMEYKDMFDKKLENINEIKKEFVKINGRNKVFNSHIDIIRDGYDSEIIKLSKVKELGLKHKNIYALILNRCG